MPAPLCIFSASTSASTLISTFNADSWVELRKMINAQMGARNIRCVLFFIASALNVDGNRLTRFWWQVPQIEMRMGQSTIIIRVLNIFPEWEFPGKYNKDVFKSRVVSLSWDFESESI